MTPWHATESSLIAIASGLSGVGGFLQGGIAAPAEIFRRMAVSAAIASNNNGRVPVAIALMVCRASRRRWVIVLVALESRDRRH
jgi:hypothetical protein